MEEIENITCAAFAAMPAAEQRAFVVGVANGRSMTVGLFKAYAGAAERMAGSDEERKAIASSYRTIRDLVDPLLMIEPASLLNGLRAACAQPELGAEFVIDALASVHLDVSKALREFRENPDGTVEP